MYSVIGSQAAAKPPLVAALPSLVVTPMLPTKTKENMTQSVKCPFPLAAEKVRSGGQVKSGQVPQVFHI